MNKTITKTTDFSKYIQDDASHMQEYQKYQEKLYTNEAIVPVFDDQKEQTTLDQTISKCIETALNSDDDKKLAEHLEELFEYQNVIYKDTQIASHLRSRSYITPHGLAVSPDHCIHTIKDKLRMKGFIRGVDAALKDLRRSFSSEPLHIVYPACGPFAPLLLPIIAYYNNEKKYASNELQITLIDIQAGAILSLRNLVQELGIQEYIKDILHINATDYVPAKGEAIHMLILESMQHGFSKEGHMAMARYFAPLLEDDGIFLPKNISVRAYLAVPQDEYVEQWKDKSKEVRASSIDESFKQMRTDLGEILSITKENILNLKEIPSNKPDLKLLVCKTLKIPEPKGEREKQMLIIHTHLDVYDDTHIGEYDSGITQPLADFKVCINFIPADKRDDDIYLNSGDLVTFYYRLDGMPGFLPHKRESVEDNHGVA